MLALVIDTSSAAVTAAVVDLGHATNDDAANDDAANDHAANDHAANDHAANDHAANDHAANGRGAAPVVLAARTTIDARAHAELLTPSIAACMDQVGLTPGDLGAVIAGVGPGPFTGLRVGLVTALAIADARTLPTYGVCSLDAIAAEAGCDGPLLVAGDARRREVYWARYSGGFPITGARLAGPHVGRASDLDRPDTERPDTDRPHTDRLDVEAMAGAGARLYAEVLGRPLLEVDYPTPLGLARLAAERVRSGAPSEPLTPLYLRRPDAVAAASFKTVTQ